MSENTNKVIQLKDTEGNDVSPVVNVGSIYDKNGQKVDNLLSYTVAGTDVPVPEIEDITSDLQQQVDSKLAAVDSTVNSAISEMETEIDTAISNMQSAGEQIGDIRFSIRDLGENGSAWVKCDGRELSASTHAQLSSAISGKQPPYEEVYEADTEQTIQSGTDLLHAIFHLDDAYAIISGGLTAAAVRYYASPRGPRIEGNTYGAYAPCGISLAGDAVVMCGSNVASASRRAHIGINRFSSGASTGTSATGSVQLEQARCALYYRNQYVVFCCHETSTSANPIYTTSSLENIFSGSKRTETYYITAAVNSDETAVMLTSTGTIMSTTSAISSGGYVNNNLSLTTAVTNFLGLIYAGGAFVYAEISSSGNVVIAYTKNSNGQGWTTVTTNITAKTLFNGPYVSGPYGRLVYYNGYYWLIVDDSSNNTKLYRFTLESSTISPELYLTMSYTDVGPMCASDCGITILASGINANQTQYPYFITVDHVCAPYIESSGADAWIKAT